MKKTDLSLQLVQRELKHRMLEEKLNHLEGGPNNGGGEEGLIGIGAAGLLSDDAENA